MDKYDVYLYVIPKLTPDQKGVLPAPPAKTQGFETLDQARNFAGQHKSEYDRVLLMKTDDKGQALVERFIDGQLETREQIVRH
jgi:hypothetical protein